MRLFFLGTHQDTAYLPRLKGCVGAAQVTYSLEPVSTWAEVKHFCEKRNITQVFTTSTALLKILLMRQHEKAAPSLANYAGSLFMRDGITVVIVAPLEQLITVSYGEHLLRRYISKLTAPETWTESTPFIWDILTPANLEGIYESYKSAYAIAVDIETTKENLAITCIGYTAVFMDGNTIRTHSSVLWLDSMFAVAWMRKFNSLPAPKILQNGKYDCAYLARYNAPVYNYLWDTINLFHCWYSEMPKDLAFIQGYSLRKSMYWKDLAKTSDKLEYAKYNAHDTHATANAWISMMISLPDYAKDNYLNEFPLVFPCHLCEMTGIERDMQELEIAAAEVSAEISADSIALDKMIGVKNFNVNSPKQMKLLLKTLGCSDLESSDEKSLMKASFRHPLNDRIFSKVLDIRGNRKLISTYLVSGKEHNNVILYALNPHGTDTSRLASREHHFWCGLQVQNIPRGKAVKRTLKARAGARMFEVDLEQAESRDTAFIAGDESLQRAVSGEKDFHSVNASAFFGVSYESIFDSVTAKTLNKALRDLAKKVNHGANYNMGAAVLVATMGLRKIHEAAALLGLPKFWAPKQIAEFLLAAFHRTYPSLRETYYPGITKEVLLTHRLTSTAIHAVPYQASSKGLVRYCFGKPDKNKSDLNSYIAHAPQSLNAQTLNKAFMRVFYEIALPTPLTLFKLLAQIHDSILGEFAEGHEHLAQRVKQCMEIPVTVKGYDGVTRTFTVPAAIKAGKDGKGALRWSETE